MAESAYPPGLTDGDGSRFRILAEDGDQFVIEPEDGGDEQRLDRMTVADPDTDWTPIEDIEPAGTPDDDADPQGEGGEDTDGQRYRCLDCDHVMPYGSWEEHGGYAYPTCLDCGSENLRDLRTGDDVEAYKRDIDSGQSADFDPTAYDDADDGDTR